MNHFLTIESLSREDIELLLSLAATMKKERGQLQALPLVGQAWAMIFTKSSTRTRVSFEIGVRELGGQIMFLSGNEIQLGRGEPIKDTARVLGRMVHGAIIRTFDQQDVVEFAAHSNIPTINALTDVEHPCQILADLQTIQEKLGNLEGRRVVFVGDAACNVATSWLWASAKMGFELRLAAPDLFQPSKDLLQRTGDTIQCFEDPQEAAQGADVIYTDVWISMGKEAESEARLEKLKNYQVNAGLVWHAKPNAMVMHCLPAYRGKEIDEETLEANAETIFTQAENRLHAQKAILAWLVT